MPIRTSVDQVLSIIEIELDENENPDNLQPFIDTATLVVDRILSEAATAPSDAEQELVERWLSAHYYHILRNQRDRERAGPVDETSQHYVNWGFQTTMYGTQAMTLDSTGILAKINAEIRRGPSAETLAASSDSPRVSLNHIGHTGRRHESY